MILLYTNNLGLRVIMFKKRFITTSIHRTNRGGNTHISSTIQKTRPFLYIKKLYEIHKDFSNICGANQTTLHIHENIRMLLGIYNRCFQHIFCDQNWDASTCSNLLKMVDGHVRNSPKTF